jgi:hypothetical protein
MPKRIGDRPPVWDDCGTRQSYNRHREFGRPPCSDCLDFMRRYQREYRRKLVVGRAFVMPTQVARFRPSMDGLGLAIARAVRESA